MGMTLQKTHFEFNQKIYTISFHYNFFLLSSKNKKIWAFLRPHSKHSNVTEFEVREKIHILRTQNIMVIWPFEWPYFDLENVIRLNSGRFLFKRSINVFYTIYTMICVDMTHFDKIKSIYN